MMSEQPLSNVLIADDHPLFREALRQVAGAVFDQCRFCEASSIEQAQMLLEDEDFDLILLDLHMPGMNGFTGLVMLRNRAPATPIVVVSAEEGRESIQEAITYGASGYIPKSLTREQMANAVREVLEGEVYLPHDLLDRGDGSGSLEDADLEARIATLTGQQRKVLEMIVMGKPNKVIAYELDLAESTVKAHVSAVLRKLHVTSRTQAVINAGKIALKLRAHP
ncbi:MAG TPA: response regulator transcription factor [Azospirillum sp.]|nr:response regulator transcription factor [Azospirillum sp.]